MAVKSLSEINETRNIENSIDENTLSSGETSGGFFGTFKIFEAVKKAVNWLTNITGNKTFEGNVQINGTFKSNIANVYRGIIPPNSTLTIRRAAGVNFLGLDFYMQSSLGASCYNMRFSGYNEFVGGRHSLTEMGVGSLCTVTTSTITILNPNSNAGAEYYLNVLIGDVIIT